MIKFRLQQIFREMAKKQRADLKSIGTFRLSLPHKILENRLNELYKFRKQHEQLSTIISRVLRRSGPVSTDGIGLTEMSPQSQVPFSIYSF
jgi:hypothetical protein